MNDLNKNCWLQDHCNKIDCDKFCLKYFKLNYLYDKALISEQQRKYIPLRLDDTLIDKEAFNFLKHIEINIENFISGRNNLYIYSQIAGNGKTSWSLRLLQSYFNKIWLKSELKCRALFINVPRFLLALKDNITQKSDYIQHIKENILDCDLVIWDDIATKAVTQFESEHLLSIIDTRINAGKSNIFTSNLNDAELHSALGDRLHSRIMGMSHKVEFKGYDKRGI